MQTATLKSAPVPLGVIQWERAAYLATVLLYLLLRLAEVFAVTDRMDIAYFTTVPNVLGMLIVAFALLGVQVFLEHRVSTMILAGMLGLYAAFIVIMNVLLLGGAFEERYVGVGGHAEGATLVISLALVVVFALGAVRLPLLWRKARDKRAGWSSGAAARAALADKERAASAERALSPQAGKRLRREQLAYVLVPMAYLLWRMCRALLIFSPMSFTHESWAITGVILLMVLVASATMGLICAQGEGLDLRHVPRPWLVLLTAAILVLVGLYIVLVSVLKVSMVYNNGMLGEMVLLPGLLVVALSAMGACLLRGSSKCTISTSLTLGCCALVVLVVAIWRVWHRLPDWSMGIRDLADLGRLVIDLAFVGVCALGAARLPELRLRMPRATPSDNGGAN